MNQRWRDRRGTYRPPSELVLTLDGMEIVGSVLARFFAKVPELPDDVCWPWQGAPNKSGYGRLHVGGVKGRHLFAHRISLALATDGPIPDHLGALHHCDTPICVNPSHLFWGSQTENMADCHRKGRVASGERHGTATKPERRARGERHGGVVLTAEQVLTIRAAYADGGCSYGTLAADFGVTRETIRDVVKRRRWRHL